MEHDDGEHHEERGERFREHDEARVDLGQAHRAQRGGDHADPDAEDAPREHEHEHARRRVEDGLDDARRERPRARHREHRGQERRVAPRAPRGRPAIRLEVPAAGEDVLRLLDVLVAVRPVRDRRRQHERREADGERGDEDDRQDAALAPAPRGVRHCGNTHGVSPASTILFRSESSLYVSMHCQNPLCSKTPSAPSRTSRWNGSRSSTVVSPSM